MLLKINPKDSYIRLTNRADMMLRHLGAGQSTRERYRDVVGGARVSKPFGDVVEQSWLAASVVDGKPVVLLVVRHPGSPPWDWRPETVSVRGAFAPEHAAELLAQGKGLLPFHQIVREGFNAADSNAN